MTTSLCSPLCGFMLRTTGKPGKRRLSSWPNTRCRGRAGASGTASTFWTSDMTTSATKRFLSHWVAGALASLLVACGGGDDGQAGAVEVPLSPSVAASAAPWCERSSPTCLPIPR